MGTDYSGHLFYPSEHRYGSTPFEWPLMDTTVGYWISAESHSQIHLLGNPVIWKTGVVATIIYILLLGIYTLFFHRGWMTPPEQPQRPQQQQQQQLSQNVESEDDEDESDTESVEVNQNQILAPSDSSSTVPSPSQDWWTAYQRGGWLLIGGYFLHFIPYLVYDHTLFLHHYIPALYFKILALAFVVDHFGGSFWCGRARILQHALAIAVLGWLAYVAFTFKTLAPLSYGDAGLSAENLKGLQLNENWDFVFH